MRYLVRHKDKATVTEAPDADSAALRARGELGSFGGVTVHEPSSWAKDEEVLCVDPMTRKLSIYQVFDPVLKLIAGNGLAFHPAFEVWKAATSL